MRQQGTSRFFGYLLIRDCTWFGAGVYCRAITKLVIGRFAMVVAKLFRGLLQLSTRAGRRYVRLSTWERVRLMWAFRNFRVLSQQLLTDRQWRLVQAVCARSEFANSENVDETVIIGTVELSTVQLHRPPTGHRLGAADSRAS